MKRQLLSAVLSSALVVGAGTACAEDKVSGNPMVVLKQMSDTLAKKPALTLSVDAVYDEKFEGTFIKSLVSYQIDVVRPTTLYFRANFDDGENWIGEFDGKRVRVYSPENKEYSEIPFDGTLDEFIDYADDNGITRTPLNDFLRTNLYEAVKDEISEATLIDGYVNPDDPKSKISHMFFKSPGTNWQLWVKHGEESLPDMFNATYVTSPGWPEYSIKFNSWSFDGKADGLSTKYGIPSSLEGWKKVEFVNPINMQ
jgi:hypothetical protein